MPTVIIKATNIPNPDGWRAGFEENAELRRQNGFQSWVMYRDPATPDTIVVVAQVESLERARAGLGAARIREVMIARAGVKGPPEMWFLEETARG